MTDYFQATAQQEPDGTTRIIFQQVLDTGEQKDLYTIESAPSLAEAFGTLSDDILDGHVFPEEFPDLEPPAGSVVMLHGDGGTAYQRHFSDGRWHSAFTGDEGLQWHEVLSENNEVRPLTIHVPKED